MEDSPWADSSPTPFPLSLPHPSSTKRDDAQSTQEGEDEEEPWGIPSSSRVGQGLIGGGGYGNAEGGLGLNPGYGGLSQRTDMSNAHGGAEADSNRFGTSPPDSNLPSRPAPTSPSRKGKERDLSPPSSPRVGAGTPRLTYTDATPMKGDRQRRDEFERAGDSVDGEHGEHGEGFDGFGQADGTDARGTSRGNEQPFLNAQDDIGDDGDDDFAFASPLPPATSSSAFPPTQTDSPDDFPDDEDPSFASAQVDGEDDFDDFGDFDDGFGDQDLGAGAGQEDEDGGGFGAGAMDGTRFAEEPEAWNEGLPERIPSLILDPFPDLQSLTSQIGRILLPIFPELLAATGSEGLDGPIEGLTEEPVRQMEGLGQILGSSSTRQLYKQMTTPPTLKPLDWTRSRTRREHLISLGVPVNLDEVESHRLTALPPLRITTNGTTPRSSLQADHSRDSRNWSASSPLAEGSGRAQKAIPARSHTKDERALGARPPMDREKAKRLLAYKEAELSLFPPKYISKMQDDLVEACSSASNVLAHLKQLVEIRQEDNKRKNEQIAEIIARAQRLKADEVLANSGGLFRKASTKRDSRTLSGSTTPKRVSSPAFR